MLRRTQDLVWVGSNEMFCTYCILNFLKNIVFKKFYFWCANGIKKKNRILYEAYEHWHAFWFWSAMVLYELVDICKIQKIYSFQDIFVKLWKYIIPFTICTVIFIDKRDKSVFSNNIIVNKYKIISIHW